MPYSLTECQIFRRTEYQIPLANIKKCLASIEKCIANIEKCLADIKKCITACGSTRPDALSEY
jgi:hypothetical protein